jgi:hypothetical protein
VISQFLWACCIRIMSKARVNFEFMLDFSPRANTNALIAFSQATRTAIFYLLSLLLYTKALIGELPNKLSTQRPGRRRRSLPPQLPHRGASPSLLTMRTLSRRPPPYLMRIPCASRRPYLMRIHARLIRISCVSPARLVVRISAHV